MPIINIFIFQAFLYLAVNIKEFLLPEGRETGKIFGKYSEREVSIKEGVGYEIRIPVKHGANKFS